MAKERLWYGLVAAVLLICLMGMVAATSHSNRNQETEVSAAFTALEGKDLPTPVSGLYGSERVNVYVNQSAFAHIVTRDSTVTDAGADVVDQPTLIVRIASAATIKTIITADNPVNTYYTLKENGDIQVEPVGFGTTVKWKVTELLGRILSNFL